VAALWESSLAWFDRPQGPPGQHESGGAGVGTDIDPQGDDALLTAEGLGKVNGTTHIFSVLGGRAASLRGPLPHTMA